MTLYSTRIKSFHPSFLLRSLASFFFFDSSSLSCILANTLRSPCDLPRSEDSNWVGFLSPLVPPPLYTRRKYADHVLAYEHLVSSYMKLHGTCPPFVGTAERRESKAIRRNLIFITVLDSLIAPIVDEHSARKA
jgi:hypothetical protein